MFGVLGTGIHVSLVVCVFFFQSRVDFRNDQHVCLVFSYFFPPSFKAVLAQVGLDMNGTDR